MKVKSESEVAQSCPTLSDPMDCSPPGSSIHGILQARVLEWGAIAVSLQTLLSAKKKKKTKQKKNSYLSRGAKDYVENKELKKQDNYCSVLLS